jgi:hypothetical protein
MSYYVISQMEEAEKLLNEFGLRVAGFNPGVSATNGQKQLNFPKNEWEFVKPLLQELVLLRNQPQKST